MNKYEKEAIEILQGFCTDDCINNDIARTIVKLIEKQQKIIDEMEEKIKKKIRYNKAFNDDIHIYTKLTLEELLEELEE